MAMFGAGKEIELLREVYDQRLSDLKERIVFLEKENERLLEALMSVQSPAAYNEMRADKLELRQAEQNATEHFSEEARQADLRRRVVGQYVDSLEKPLWNTAEEFDDTLKKWLGDDWEDLPSVPPPVHSNTES